ncbi:MAG TPA: GNAT family N-acetyltransferase [Propionibacteriaceae bacterium]
MDSPDPTLTVHRHDQLSRYEARWGTELVTVIDFVLDGELMTITHTGTDPQWRGRGFAAQATQAALEDIRAIGRTVRPVCPFTVDFMDAHPEFGDLRR